MIDYHYTVLIKTRKKMQTLSKSNTIVHVIDIKQDLEKFFLYLMSNADL